MAVPAPQRIDINGKIFTLTRLRIRDHVQQKWREIDVNTCPNLVLVAHACQQLYTQTNPANAADLKKLSFTFELGISGNAQNLNLKRIEYIDSTSTKTQTYKVDLEEYPAPQQQQLKTTANLLLQTTQELFRANLHRQGGQPQPFVPADDTDDEALENFVANYKIDNPIISPNSLVLDDTGTDDDVDGEVLNPYLGDV